MRIETGRDASTKTALGVSGDGLPGTRHPCCAMLDGAFHRQRVLGARDFFVSQKDMIQLLRHVLGQASRPVISLNRPQIGGTRLVHRVEWLGLIFKSVSLRPIAVN